MAIILGKQFESRGKKDLSLQDDQLILSTLISSHLIFQNLECSLSDCAELIIKYTIMDQSPVFSMPKFLNLLELLETDLETLNEWRNFVEFCREATKIFMQMGGILKKAFEDINAKCNLIVHNHGLHKEIHQGLIDFIILEKQLDIAKYNGQNNDHLKGTDQEFYYNYESSARTTLRLMWFLDFVFHMIDGLIKDKNKGLGSICQNAYNIALGPNHPLTIRMGVKVGMLTVGSRESLYKIIFPNQEDPYTTLPYIRDKIGKLSQRLWQLYKAEKLCDLP